VWIVSFILLMLSSCSALVMQEGLKRDFPNIAIKDRLKELRQ
jgi:hypothetical protein